MIILSGNLFAQLDNTKWIAEFKIPTEVNCYLEFKKDTLDMIEVQNDVLLEQMKITIKSDTLTFTKITGGSPCEQEDKGIYRWKVEDNTLMLTMISDDCQGRSAAGFDGIIMQKVIAAASKKE